MAPQTCLVSFLDRGKPYAVEVYAETAYEAAALALNAFEKMGRHVQAPGKHAVLEIELKTPRTFKVKVGDVIDWLYTRPATSAEENERKKRLRNVLAADRH